MTFMDPKHSYSSTPEQKDAGDEVVLGRMKDKHVYFCNDAHTLARMLDLSDCVRKKKRKGEQDEGNPCLDYLHEVIFKYL